MPDDITNTRRPTAPEQTEKDEPHPIDPAIQLLKQCEQKMASIRDYSVIFVRQEMVAGKLTPQTYMQAKFRCEPFSVYLKWLQPQAGKEAIYVQGAFEDQILTHGTGLSKALTGTVRVDPDSPQARQDSRQSIRELGINNLIRRLLRLWEFERRFQQTQVSISSVAVNGRPCHLITTVHPVPDDGKFIFHTLKVYIDQELLLPIRTEGYGFPDEPGPEPGQLLECHTYLNLQLNPGFTDRDFSPDNPEYSFSRF